MSDDICQKNLIRECCQEVKDLEGDAVEIGVHQGDSAEVICDSLPDSTVYLFDTFQGMPANRITQGLDTHLPSDFRDTSEKRVKERFKDRKAVVVSGIFPESAKVEPRIKFAHVDVDLYESTKAAMKWCWDHMVEGGVILNDDYLCSSCPGAKKAVDEFCLSHGARCEVTRRRAIVRRHV